MGACATKLQKEHGFTDKKKKKYKVRCPSNVDLPECPQRLLSAKSLPKLSVIEQRNELMRIDKLLSAYYHQFGNTDYMDTNTKIGKFLQYIIDNKLTDIDLSGDHDQSSDLSYLRFDPQFPLSPETEIYLQNNSMNKEHAVHYVICYCLEYNAHPTINRCIYLQSVCNTLSDHNVIEHIQMCNSWHWVDIRAMDV